MFVIAQILPFSPVKAGDERFTIIGYVTDLKQANVGDGQTLYLGIVSGRGLVFFENGEVATYREWQTFESDFGKLERTSSGYGLITYKDSSSVLFEIRGRDTSQLPWWFSHGRTEVNGKMKYVRGTGRFERIKGTGTYTGRGISSYIEGNPGSGDFFLEFQVSYDLP